MKALAIIMVLVVALLGCKKDKAPELQKQAQKVRMPEAPKKEEASPQKQEEKKVEVEAYSYDPRGRRDPFLSIIEASKRQKEAEAKRKSAKPSEMFDIADVKILAIAKDKNRYYAMIQLPDKKYFTIKEGMSLGPFGGKVIKIDSGSIVVREYIRDYKGELQAKETILKLRKEEGE